MPLATGDRLGPYEILSPIGEGGMGEVFKARDTRLGRAVALKSLPASFVSDPRRRDRFLQEAQASSALNHPNIVTIHDWIESDGNHVLVMEHITGKTLDQIIPKKGLRLNDALKYATQIADALAAAHAHGIIHRDVKPANIMVTPEGRVKVLDFGLAKLTEQAPPSAADATLTARAISEEGTVAGSAPYMSPEQAEGKKLDARSDIFSFGAVLYEMLTGQRAFQGDSRVSTMAAILKSEPKPASQLAEVLPKELDRILTRCLRKDVERRSQSMAEIKLELDEIREESESGMLPAAAAPAPHKKRSLRWPTLALILVAAAAAWLLLRNRTPQVPHYTLRQITRDDARSGSAAVSPDGKFIVYTSDRLGQPDLWIQRTSGGDPVRLTNSPGVESSPQFSPDGSLIMFRRTSDESIQLIPTLGGPERQIAAVGRAAKFSPDGLAVAYAVGNFTDVKTNSIWVVPVGGGQRREVIRGFGAGALEWSPDGSRLLVADSPGLGVTGPVGSVKWYLLPIKGGQPAAVQGLDELLNVCKSQRPYPVAWLNNPSRVIFGTDGQSHIWSVGLGLNGKLENPPVQLTNGTDETPGQPSADGRIIPLVVGSGIFSIHSLSLDANRAVASGEPQRFISTDGGSMFPVFTADGSKMSYVSNRSGNDDVWIRDMQSGRDTPALSSPERESRGIISPDGSKMALLRAVNGKQVSYWMPLPSGDLTAICEGCRSLLSWTPDGSGILVSQGPPETLVVHELATGKRYPTATHPKFPLNDVVFSPDSKWFAFKILETNTTNYIYVSPAVSGRATQQSEWIPIAGKSFSGRPFWSPDGNTLYYFTSDGQGRLTCLYARHLDPTTKQPRGEPFAVYHFHGRLIPASYPFIGYGLTSDHLYLPLRDWTSQIWVAEASGEK